MSPSYLSSFRVCQPPQDDQRTFFALVVFWDTLVKVTTFSFNTSYFLNANDQNGQQKCNTSRID